MNAGAWAWAGIDLLSELEMYGDGRSGESSSARFCTNVNALMFKDFMSDILVSLEVQMSSTFP